LYYAIELYTKQRESKPYPIHIHPIFQPINPSSQFENKKEESVSREKKEENSSPPPPMPSHSMDADLAVLIHNWDLAFHDPNTNTTQNHVSSEL
jgi:hypothetical protein